MRRVLAVLVAVPFLLVGGRWLVHALASDETRIERLARGMRAGFDRGHAGDATGGLTSDWRHEGSTIDRQTLRAALFRRFQLERGSERRTRVSFERDELAIVIDPGGDTATLTAELHFERRDGEAWRTVWRLRAEAELRDTEDGWRIVRSRHVNLEGRGLGR